MEAILNSETTHKLIARLRTKIKRNSMACTHARCGLNIPNRIEYCGNLRLKIEINEKTFQSVIENAA